jgi:anti-sigma factor RsiW
MDVGAAAHGSRDLRCIEVVELVTEYLEGALPGDDVVRLERHLRACDGCAAYVEQFRQLIQTAGHLEPEAVPPEAMERLLHVYREFKGTDR